MTLSEGMTDEEFSNAFSHKFDTVLSNGKIVELQTGHFSNASSDKQVTKENYAQYIELVLEARSNEAKQQMEWFRQGFEHIVPIKTFHILSWNEVEERVVGKRDVTTQ